jgi:murein DD-endopeptidase MepM/ murein hydrolase activator NlpD
MKRLALCLLLVSCSSVQTPEFSPQAQEPAKPKPTDTYIASPLKTGPPVTEATGILLSWPLKGTIDMTRGFITGFHPHQGLDLAAPKGTLVRAAHAGYVEYTGKDFSGYGNLVILNSGSHWATFYAHLSKILVREGQNIKRGGVLGKVGATGNARGVHLHFELRHDEMPVDPMAYLP